MPISSLKNSKATEIRIEGNHHLLKRVMDELARNRAIEVVTVLKLGFTRVYYLITTSQFHVEAPMEAANDGDFRNHTAFNGLKLVESDQVPPSFFKVPADTLSSPNLLAVQFLAWMANVNSKRTGV